MYELIGMTAGALLFFITLWFAGLKERKALRMLAAGIPECEVMRMLAA